MSSAEAAAEPALRRPQPWPPSRRRPIGTRPTCSSTSPWPTTSATVFHWSNETPAWRELLKEVQLHPQMIVGVSDGGAHLDRDDGQEWSTHFLSTWWRTEQRVAARGGRAAHHGHTGRHPRAARPGPAGRGPAPPTCSCSTPTSSTWARAARSSTPSPVPPASAPFPAASPPPSSTGRSWWRPASAPAPPPAWWCGRHERSPPPRHRLRRRRRSGHAPSTPTSTASPTWTARASTGPGPRRSRRGGMPPPSAPPWITSWSPRGRPHPSCRPSPRSGSTRWVARAELALARWVTAFGVAKLRCADGGVVVAVVDRPAPLDSAGWAPESGIADAVEALTRSLARSEGPRRVRVDAVTTPAGSHAARSWIRRRRWPPSRARSCSRPSVPSGSSSRPTRSASPGRSCTPTAGGRGDDRGSDRAPRPEGRARHRGQRWCGPRHRGGVRPGRMDGVDRCSPGDPGPGRRRRGRCRRRARPGGGVRRRRPGIGPRHRGRRHRHRRSTRRRRPQRHQRALAPPDRSGRCPARRHRRPRQRLGAGHLSPGRRIPSAPRRRRRRLRGAHARRPGSRARPACPCTPR